MKRTFSILTLAAVAGLILGSRAIAAPPSHAMAVQVATHAVAHPGRHHRGSNYHYYGHSRRSYLHHPPIYRPPYRGPVYRPVIVAPQYYPPYYGPQGGVMIQGRSWGFGIGF